MLKGKSVKALVLALLLWMTAVLPAGAQVKVSAPSVILIESSTGQVIFEQNSTERRSPASITKIMTLLLIFQALDDGKISLDDKVITSEHASSMGGSQVYLAEGEVQSLDTMIKCIVVSSGNDASVAVAEHIAGSEEAFVDKMNEKAEELLEVFGLADEILCVTCPLEVRRGMTDNHF